MIISIELAEWIQSAILQAQASLLGLNIAVIGIATVFLYRSGQFNKNIDSQFENNYTNFEKNIKISFTLGFITIVLDLLALITLETINYNLLRSITCWIISSVFVLSVYFTLAAGFSILKTIENKMRKNQ